MNQPFLRRYVLEGIERRGRRQGAPVVTFPQRTISVQGESINVADGIWYLVTRTSGFYLSLPANAFGVVVFPDGTSHNMEGGVHDVPPGLYRLHYVDKHERMDHSSPISELTTDGEKLTLKVVLRYRVVDPITALRIDRPIENIIEHVEADIAQYIRTHDHSDIADGAEQNQDSKLLSFFIQRHNRRFPLSKAFIITGIELMEFTGDNEYVEMRRAARTNERKLDIEREQIDRQREVEQIKTNFQTEIENLKARAAAEREVAEKEILLDSRKKDIELENLRTQSKWRHELVIKAVDAIGQALEPSAYPRNTTEIKSIVAELLGALREDKPVQSGDIGTEKNEKASTPRPTNLSPADQKIESLTSTLLDLLKPRK